MTWNLRARNRNLELTDSLIYSSLELQTNHNRPDTLLVHGDLDSLAPAMAPGSGVVLRDPRGMVRFSGWLVNPVERRDDGRVTLGYVGDLVVLFDRAICPNPAQPLTAQVGTAYTVTGPAETRITQLVNVNAGPGAYHAAPLATAGATFNHLVTLTPENRTRIGQSFAVDPETGSIYLTQVSGSDDSSGSDKLDELWISRFTAAGEYKSTMYVRDGGHGDLFMVQRDGKAVMCRFRYRGLSGSHDTSGQWVKLPYTPGKKWTTPKTIRKYAAGAPRTTKPGRRGWFQGEARRGGTFYRLYGTPYNTAGPTGTAMPGFVEVIEDGVIVSTIDVSALGRDGSGNPVGGRLEPEGLTIAKISGTPHLLVGIAVGSKGAYQHMIYAAPLAVGDADSDELDDRRVPSLRVPASSGRGSTARTTARLEDNLGAVVSAIATRANLTVQVVQDHDPDGTPFLDMRVTDAPDLTEWARFGTPGSGGVAMLGPGWRHTSHAPDATVVIASAGEGTTRMLRQGRNLLDEDTWGRRIERVVDKRGTTDEAEIRETLDDELAATQGGTEITAPLSADNIGIGETVPVGARVAAVVDGLPVTDRIRRITTVIGEDGQVTVTPVIGSPDAALTRSTRQTRRLLGQLTHLEATTR